MRDRSLPCLWPGAALLLLAGCSAEPPAEVACQSTETVEVFCDYQQPEDIELIPGSPYLLISEMGGRFGEAPKPGYLSFHDRRSGEHHRAEIRTEPTAGWGDLACEPPENMAMSPHGIHLTGRRDGQLQLTVVNHLQRESIELFDIVSPALEPVLVWRGCILPPDGAFINDITVTPDGRIFMTHMFEIESLRGLLVPKLVLGMDTGFVWSWSADGGFERLPGSDGSFPNGISSDDSGDTLFVNYYTGSQTRALDSRTGEQKGVYPVQHPDNVVYSQGSIYIASHEIALGESDICIGRRTTCPLAYAIHRLDAETMQGGQIVSGMGIPFGLATVGVPDGDWLWMGSFLGDRIARVRLSER